MSMTMKHIDFSVLGVGAWGANFRNADDLNALLQGQNLEDDGAKGPKPEVIPANERRRAPLPVRLAVETSWQACQNASLDSSTLGCVFVSGLGDTQLTDYMCKVLSGDNKALSPTKFHNSVHNAAAGYWTISTGCMQAANSVAGYEESVPLTLVESLIQAETEQRPILMTFYDAPVSPVLKPILKNEHAFSVSIILAPASLGLNSNHVYCASVEHHEQQAAQWPSGDWQEPLASCYQTNPVARVLPLLELFNANSNGNNDQHSAITMPLSPSSQLTIKST